MKDNKGPHMALGFIISILDYIFIIIISSSLLYASKGFVHINDCKINKAEKTQVMVSFGIKMIIDHYMVEIINSARVI